MIVRDATLKKGLIYSAFSLQRRDALSCCFRRLHPPAPSGPGLLSARWSASCLQATGACETPTPSAPWAGRAPGRAQHSPAPGHRTDSCCCDHSTAGRPDRRRDSDAEAVHRNRHRLHSLTLFLTLKRLAVGGCQRLLLKRKKGRKALFSMPTDRNEDL